MYSHKLQLNIEGKRIVPVYKQLKPFEIKNFSDLFIQGSKVEQPPNTAATHSSLTKMVKYRNRIKHGLGTSSRRNSRIKSSHATRKLFESILIQPKVDNVSDYVKNLSNILRSSNTTFVNLNDLKNCLKMSVASIGEAANVEPKSYVNLDNRKILKSASFSNFSEYQ